MCHFLIGAARSVLMATEVKGPESKEGAATASTQLEEKQGSGAASPAVGGGNLDRSQNPTFWREFWNLVLLLIIVIAVCIPVQIYWLPLKKYPLWWGGGVAFSMVSTILTAVFQNKLPDFSTELFRRIEGCLKRSRVTPYLLLLGTVLFFSAACDGYRFYRFSLLQIVPTKGLYGVLSGTTPKGSNIDILIRVRRKGASQPGRGVEQRIFGLSSIYSGESGRYLRYRILQSEPVDKAFAAHLKSIGVEGEGADQVIQEWKGDPQPVDSETVKWGDVAVIQLNCHGECLLTEEVGVDDDPKLVFLGESLEQDPFKKKLFDQAVDACFSKVP
jgi:hypothetical protein